MIRPVTYASSRAQRFSFIERPSLPCILNCFASFLTLRGRFLMTKKSIYALPYNLLIAVTPSYSAHGLENVKRLLIEFFRNSDASVPTPKILVAFH